MKSAASRIALTATLLVAACGGADARVSGPSAPVSQGPAGDYPMVLGDPFTIDGVTYTPSDTMNYDSVGYAHDGEGQGVSGAHRTLPLPSYVEVTSLDTGRTILVRLTRRGPMAGGDLIELSPAAWAELGMQPGRRTPVRVRRVNPPEVERALLRTGQAAPARMDTPPGLLAALVRKLDGGTSATKAPSPPAPPVAKPAPAPVPSRKELPNVKDKALQPVAAGKPESKADPTPESQPKAPLLAGPKPEVKPAPKVAQAQVPGLFVQVGAFSAKARAQKVAQASGGSLYQAGNLWRVRSGPYKDRGEAEAALAKARASGYADARIVSGT